MKQKSSNDAIIEKARSQDVHIKILESNVVERDISDKRYAPMEVKVWFIWLVSLILSTVLLAALKVWIIQ